MLASEKKNLEHKEICPLTMISRNIQAFQVTTGQEPETSKMELVAKIQVHSTCPEGELRFVALSCNGFDKQKRAFHDTTTAGPTEISKKRPIGAYIIKFI